MVVKPEIDSEKWPYSDDRRTASRRYQTITCQKGILDLKNWESYLDFSSTRSVEDSNPIIDQKDEDYGDEEPRDDNRHKYDRSNYLNHSAQELSHRFADDVVKCVDI